MRILFITEQLPYPLDNGGNVRTFNILRGLAQAHEVTLLGTHMEDVPESHRRALEQVCSEIKLVRIPRATLAREGATFARSLVTSRPFLLLRHTAPAVRRQLRALFAAQSPGFDAVHFNHLDTTLYESHIPRGVLRVLDQHNIVTNQVRTARVAEHRLLRRMVLGLDLPKLRAFETRVCNAMDVCLVCSDADQAALVMMGVKTAIAVVPNGADIQHFVPLGRPTGSGPEVVFVGALDYDPCEQGVWYFCTQVLPLLRRSLPDLRFVVVGRNPSTRLRALAQSDSNIVLTGRVEDVRPHVQRAGACVVPLLSGSGTRLKIIEAMAMGVPVVSTSIGAEGIAGTDGLHLRIADSASLFARAVLSILQDPAEAERLRRAARMLVQERYTWQGACRAVLHAYSNPTAARAQAASP